MKFIKSYSGLLSLNTPAIEIWDDWEILWDKSGEDLLETYVIFLAKKDIKYSIGSYGIKNSVLSYGQYGFSVVNYDLINKMKWTEKQKEPYLKNSLFFETYNSLFNYAKILKREYVLNGEKDNDYRKDILISIKKEYFVHQKIIEQKISSSISRLDEIE